MLQTLTIKNYAIIEQAGIFPDKGLNVIIGETGAGKSILLGALGLILGKRADSGVLRNPQEKCFVEAVFKIDKEKLSAFFEENELDADENTVIRREINISGKSRAFINDTPVTLEVLRELTEKLVDIHAQHETQQMLEKNYFIQLLDKITQQTPILTEYQSILKEYRKLNTEYQKFLQDAAAFSKEYEFIHFQFKELDEAGLSAEEWSGLEAELDLLLNAELIRQNLSGIADAIDNEQSGILQQLATALKRSAQISSFHDDLSNLHESFNNITDELREHLRKIRQMEAGIDADEERIRILSEKQNIVNRLLQKHHFQQIEELIDLRNTLSDKLEKFSFSNDKKQELEKAIEEKKIQLIALAESLFQNRMKAAEPFANEITTLIHELGIPFGKVAFTGNFKPDASPSNLGMDEIELLFAPNKGSALQSLNDVGSGGEKSRLMLAIKSITARYMDLPTLIFDEIDTGISGETGLKVGQMLRQLGKHHQVISITHLPQVAAGAHQLFYVYKNHNAEISATEIKPVKGDDAVIEIARMLSGQQPTPAAIENARNLMNL